MEKNKLAKVITFKLVKIIKVTDEISMTKQFF